MMRAHGLHVIDADQIARNMLNPGTSAYEEVVRAFGEGILSAGTGSPIDRKKLAALAFQKDKPRVAELNAIMHPAIIAEQEHWFNEMQAADPHGIAVVEAALILEAEADNQFDRIVLVVAPEEERVKRFIARLGDASQGNEHEALRRIAAQMPDSEKQKRAHFVIQNHGSLAELETQVDAVVRSLRSSV